MGYYAALEKLNAERKRLQADIQRLQADKQIIEAKNIKLRSEIKRLQDERSEAELDNQQDDDILCHECYTSIPENFDRPMHSIERGFGCNQCGEATLIGGDEVDQYPLSDCCNPLWEDPTYDGDQLRLLCRQHMLKALVE
jgi:hypothetical protein